MNVERIEKIERSAALLADPAPRVVRALCSAWRDEHAEAVRLKKMVDRLANRLAVEGVIGPGELGELIDEAYIGDSRDAGVQGE